jgi:cyclase
MKRKVFRMPALYITCSLLCLLGQIVGYSQAANESDKITIRSTPAGGVVTMLDCENGFGGGNVAASIGPDGILLVDDMYKAITPRLLEALKKTSHADVRIVVNTHFHADHIEGNFVMSRSSVIIAQENVLKRFRAKQGWATPDAFPQLVFRDSMTLHFNGEDIRLFHLPNGHTDNDVYVYFPLSGVIHMGDTYFNGMFPAVYKEGGGDILQLIVNLEKVLAILPENTKVIPGHGDLATRADLLRYVSMLKETTAIVQTALRNGKTLEQLKTEKPLAKYDSLGRGGAQTTDQYLAMLYKLLSP